MNMTLHLQHHLHSMMTLMDFKTLDDMALRWPCPRNRQPGSTTRRVRLAPATATLLVHFEDDLSTGLTKHIDISGRLVPFPR